MRAASSSADLGRLAARLPGPLGRELRGAARRDRARRGAPSTGSAPTAAATSPSLSRSSSPSGVQIRDRAHPVLGQRPGLVGADDRRRAERLDRAQPLDERAAAREARHADRERERDRRQQPLGHVGDDQADREGDRVVRAGARRRASRSGGTRGRRRRRRARSARRRGAPARSSGLSSTSTRCESAAIRPSSVCIPVAKTSARASPPTQRRAAEDEVAAPRAAGRSCRRARPRGAPAATRPVSVDRSTSTAPSSSRASAEIRSPSTTSRTSPGHELARVDRRALAVAEHSRLQRAGSAAAPRPRARPAAPATNAKSGVEDDHERRSRRRGSARPPTKASTAASPEEQRERVGELLQRARAASAGRRAARARSARRRRGGAAPRGSRGPSGRAEVAEEQLDRLARLGLRIGRAHDSIVRFHQPRRIRAGTDRGVGDYVRGVERAADFSIRADGRLRTARRRHGRPPSSGRAPRACSPGASPRR